MLNSASGANTFDVGGDRGVEELVFDYFGGQINNEEKKKNVLAHLTAFAKQSASARSQKSSFARKCGCISQFRVNMIFSQKNDQGRTH